MERQHMNVFILTPVQCMGTSLSKIEVIQGVAQICDAELYQTWKDFYVLVLNIIKKECDFLLLYFDIDIL